MPPKKRKAGAEDQGEENVPVAPKKRQKKAVLAATASNEYAEDPIREQSRQLLGWGEWQNNAKRTENRKTHAFLKDFEHDIEKNREETARSLADLESVQLGLVESVASRIKDLIRGEGVNVKQQQQPLFREQQRTLALCHSVLEMHQKTEAQIQRQDVGSPREQWDEDITNMTQVIEYGEMIAFAIVRGFVVPTSDVSGIMRVNEQNLDGMGAVAVGLLKDSRAGLGKRETWASDAQAQIHALATLTRNLSTGKG